MICPKCKMNNDDDAKYCEKCGQSINKNSFSNLSSGAKIIILVGIMFFMVVGISAGALLKNTQNSNQNNNTIPEISETSGFPVSEAPNLAYELSKYDGDIESINYGSVKLDKNQCIYILAKAIVMIKNGENGTIPISSFNSPESPQGYITNAVINQNEYLDIATRTYNWMDNNGVTPNYIGISTPGQADLSPDTLLNLLTKVLLEYNSTGQLPTSVSIP
jgi:hypothetical protein